MPSWITLISSVTATADWLGIRLPIRRLAVIFWTLSGPGGAVNLLSVPESTPPQRLYEADAVDAYISDLRAQLEDLQHRLEEREAAPAATDTDALVRKAITRGAAIVSDARAEAAEIVHAAHDEAEALVAAAHDRAEITRDEAQTYTDERRAAAEAEAKAIVDHARADADRIIGEAQSKAQAIVADAETEGSDRQRSSVSPRSADADQRILEQIEGSHRRLLEMFSAIVDSVRSPAAAATQPSPFAPTPIMDLPSRHDPPPASVAEAAPDQIRDDRSRGTSVEDPPGPVASEPIVAEPTHVAPEPVVAATDSAESDVDLTALEPDDRRFFDELRASLRSGGTPVRDGNPEDRLDRGLDEPDFAGRHAGPSARPIDSSGGADLSALPPPDPSALVEPYEDEDQGSIRAARWVRRKGA